MGESLYFLISVVRASGWRLLDELVEAVPEEQTAHRAGGGDQHQDGEAEVDQARANDRADNTSGVEGDESEVEGGGAPLLWHLSGN